MSKNLTQKEYLKKYLSKGDGKKSKKKKNRDKKAGDGLKIIDDDISAANVQYSDQVELEFMLAEEDAPQVAEIIDETKINAIARTTENWKTVSEPVWGKRPNNEKILISDNDLSPVRNNNTSGKNNSDRDNSPPRRRKFDKEESYHKSSQPDKYNKYSKNDNSRNYSERRCRSPSNENNYNSGRDYEQRGSSNRRKREHSEDMMHNNRNYDSDYSPPRKSKNDYELVKSHKKNHEQGPPKHSNYDRRDRNNYHKSRHDHRNSDNDQSPPLKNIPQVKSRTDAIDLDRSPPRKSSSNLNNPDITQMKSSRYSDDDHSPPRKLTSISGNRPQNKSGFSDSDGDQSPPRKSNYESTHKRNNKHESSQRKSRFEDSDGKYDQQMQKARRTHSDDDLELHWKSGSSKHKSQQHSDYVEKYNKQSTTSKQKPTYSDDDQSPPRKSGGRYQSPPHRSHKESEKMTKTLDGKTAGLQNARGLRDETEKIRRKEKDLLLNMNDEISGRYAKTVSRKSGRNQKSDSDDEETKKLKQAREKEKKEKYSRWGKGLKQVEEQQARLEDALHEMNKPLARYADDQDLDKHLRERIHLDDPMLQYMQRKKMEENVKEGMKVRPQYQGSFPPNRFDIRPGYRWDGVDRSNGYEKKWFEKINSRKANEEEAYKWSTEDM